MSDAKTPTQFGQPPAETKKNPKVFNLPIKIAPYAPQKVPAARPKGEKFDPFSVTFEAPKGGT